MEGGTEPDIVYAFDSDEDVCNIENNQADKCRLDALKVNECLSLDSYEDIDKRNPFVCKPGKSRIYTILWRRHFQTTFV